MGAVAAGAGPCGSGGSPWSPGWPAALGSPGSLGRRARRAFRGVCPVGPCLCRPVSRPASLVLAAPNFAEICESGSGSSQLADLKIKNSKNPMFFQCCEPQKSGTGGNLRIWSRLLLILRKSANKVPAAPSFAGVRGGGSWVSRLCGCRAGSVSAGPVLGGWRRRGGGCAPAGCLCAVQGFGGVGGGGSSGGDRLGCVPPVVGGVGWGASCSPGLVWAWGWLVWWPALGGGVIAK